MNNFLRILGIWATVTTAPLRGCLPSDVHGIRYVRDHVPEDVFIRLSEKIAPCSPEKRTQTWKIVEDELIEGHVIGERPEMIANVALRSITCP